TFTACLTNNRESEQATMRLISHCPEQGKELVSSPLIAPFLLVGSVFIPSRLAKEQRHAFAAFSAVTQIWELNYIMFSNVLFKCDWVENMGGLKIDEIGHTLVDLNLVGHKSDCFILASQARQVFYVPDQMDPRWSVVCFIPLKDYRHKEVNNQQDNVMEHEPIVKVFPNVEIFDSDSDDAITYVRNDCE
ncbi:hypothetical protein Ddye_009064, partial [Dipteronia dyeriana]